MTTLIQPTWRPAEVESPLLISALAASYTSRTRALVVYKYGTVVFSDTASARSDEDYGSTLLNVTKSAPDFTVREMDDGNYLVRFKGPVASIVIAQFYFDRMVEFRNSVISGGFLPGESVIAGSDTSMPDNHYFIGLYARAKFFADAESLEIVERFIP